MYTVLLLYRVGGGPDKMDSFLYVVILMLLLVPWDHGKNEEQSRKEFLHACAYVNAE